MEALKSQITQPQACPFQSQAGLRSERSLWTPETQLSSLQGAALTKEDAHGDTKGGWEHKLILSHAIPERLLATPRPWSIQHVIKVTFCMSNFPAGQCTWGIRVCLHKYLYPDIQHAGRSSTNMSARRDATQDWIKKYLFIYFFFLFPGIYAWLRGVGISHFSCPFRLGLQDWSSEKGQSQCFNWSSIPAETTLRLFVCFPWKKLQVAMHSIPNLPSHLQQKDGGESTPAGAQQKLLGCSYASLCSEPSLMGASQLFLISADVDWSDPHQKSKQ